MEIIGTICILIFTLVILAAAILYFNKKDDTEKKDEEISLQLTNETKIRLQFEKAISEIKLLDQKREFFKSLTDFFNLICIIIVIGLIIFIILSLASMAGCAGIIKAIK